MQPLPVFTVLEFLLHPPTVLFLYDLKYAWPPCSQVNNHDTVELGSDAEIKWISYLLDLSDEWLKQALTSKVTVSLLLAILFVAFIKACDVQCNLSELCGYTYIYVSPGVEWLIGYDLVLFMAWTVWIFSKLKKEDSLLTPHPWVMIWTSLLIRQG